MNSNVLSHGAPHATPKKRSLNVIHCHKLANLRENELLIIVEASSIHFAQPSERHRLATGDQPLLLISQPYKNQIDVEFLVMQRFSALSWPPISNNLNDRF